MEVPEVIELQPGFGENLESMSDMLSQGEPDIPTGLQCDHAKKRDGGIKK